MLIDGWGYGPCSVASASSASVTRDWPAIRGSHCLIGTHKDFDGILWNMPVGGDQRGALDNGLGDEHVVEGITVVDRQFRQTVR